MYKNLPVAAERLDVKMTFINVLIFTATLRNPNHMYYSITSDEHDATFHRGKWQKLLNPVWNLLIGCGNAELSDFTGINKQIRWHDNKNVATSYVGGRHNWFFYLRCEFESHLPLFIFYMTQKCCLVGNACNATKIVGQ